jgi:HK97 family phage major capsid protein
MLTTTRDTIKYMKETTLTNNAAETLESGAYGEAALALTEQSDEVEKIAVFLPVTDEQLEDVAALAGYINSRLTYMLRARLDGQILVGDGSTPNLLGTLNLASLLSQAKSTDPTPDAFYKAMTQVRVTGFAEPSVCFIHPNDWQSIRLLRTADGIYIFGNPMQAGPSQLWGVPVVQTTRETENTGIVGDYRGFSNLYMRRGVTLKVTDSHASNFTQGVQVIRADMRVAMVHYRDTAFCKVTGI